MTTSTKLHAVGKLHGPSIARLQSFEVHLIVAIETVVVPIVSAVAHDNIGVLLRHDDGAVRIETEGRWLAFFVASVAVEI